MKWLAKSSVTIVRTIILFSCFKELDPLLISFIIALVSTFVTEVASNTACANILVPILSKMSLSLCTNPLYLMMTCAVCVRKRDENGIYGN